MSCQLNVLVIIDQSADPLSLDETSIDSDSEIQFTNACSEEQLNQHCLRSRVDIAVLAANRLTWVPNARALKIAKSRMPECPVVMLVDPESASTVNEVIPKGLDDFIVDDQFAAWRLSQCFERQIRQRQIQSRAKHLAERIDQISDHLRLGIFSCDSDGCFVEVNDAMKRLLACKFESELFHSNLVSLLGDPDRGSEYLSRLLQSRVPTEIEFERTDGQSTRIFRLTAKANSDQGATTTIDGFIKDVTAQKVFAFESKRASSAMERINSLSPRERQVFEMVSEGTPNKVIARKLEISEKTVEKHRASLMRKLKVVSVAALVRLATYAEHGVA